MAEPVARLGGVVLECPEPAALARFYADLTGWVITWSDQDWYSLAPAEGARPQLAFQRAPEYKAPVWPDPASSMQMHLDFTVDDLDQAERQARELGATKFDHQPDPENFRVLADPVGHPFCVCIN